MKFCIGSISLSSAWCAREPHDFSDPTNPIAQKLYTTKKGRRQCGPDILQTQKMLGEILLLTQKKAGAYLHRGSHFRHSANFRPVTRKSNFYIKRQFFPKGLLLCSNRLTRKAVVPCQWPEKKLRHVSLGYFRVRLPGSLLRCPANMEVEALGVCCQASCDLVSSRRCAKTVTVSGLPWTIK